MGRARGRAAGRAGGRAGGRGAGRVRGRGGRGGADLLLRVGDVDLAVRGDFVQQRLPVWGRGG